MPLPTRSPFRSFVALTAAFFIAGYAPRTQSPPAQTVAITNVDVISMTDDRVRRNQTVVVEGGIISAMGDAATVRPPAGARIIDGRGRWLIPGLTDAHVHLMEKGDLAQALAFGVTTIRHLLGSDEILGWRREIAAGTIPGPRMIVSGPTFAGATIPWKNKVVIADPDAARAEVRRQRDAGYDLIKVYDGVSAAVYAAIIDESRKAGLRVTGHIPADVHLAGVLAAKQDLEHVDKTVFDVWGHAFDSTRIDSVARAIKAAGVFVTPTIAVMEQNSRVGAGGFDSLLARPEARRAGDVTFNFWCEVSARMKGNRPPRPGVRFDPWADFQLKLIGELHRAGVPLLAGTDYPNGVLSAGGGLIDEVRALTDAGLSNFEALKTATVNPARAFGDSTSGAIRVGARADLVLLRENPLDALVALRSVDGVMAAGRWYAPSDLDRMAPERRTPARCGG